MQVRILPEVLDVFMVTVVSADSTRGRGPRGTGSSPVGHPSRDGGDLHGSPGGRKRERGHNSVIAPNVLSDPIPSSVHSPTPGAERREVHSRRRRGGSTPSRRIPRGGLTQEVHMLKWMMAALGLVGLGAGVLYRNRKDVRVPHRWYL